MVLSPGIIIAYLPNWGGTVGPTPRRDRASLGWLAGWLADACLCELLSLLQAKSPQRPRKAACRGLWDEMDVQGMEWRHWSNRFRVWWC